MDLKSFGEALAKIGLPLLGSALPIPGGAAIGMALADAIGSPSDKPDDILATLTQSADALQRASEFEMTHQATILKITVDAEIEARKADSADIATVNETIREELKNSANESWMQKSWRPANGFSVAIGSFVSILFTCWLFYQAIINKDPSALNQIPALATAIAMILAVPGAAVGITAWHRGKLQREESGK